MKERLIPHNVIDYYNGCLCLHFCSFCLYFQVETQRVSVFVTLCDGNQKCNIMSYCSSEVQLQYVHGTNRKPCK